MISINLSKEELVLTYVLIIFCEDRHGLEEVSQVSQTQEKFAFILQQLMNLSKNTQKRNGKNRFPVSQTSIPRLRRSHMSSRDSMILTFHVPPPAIRQGLVDVISIVCSPGKYQNIGKSWQDEIRPIIRVFPFDF